jgi:hypothetical protein
MVARAANWMQSDLFETMLRPDYVSKEAEMTTTTLTLKTIEVVSKRIPRRSKKLGQMLVFNEDITEINGVPSSVFPVPSLGPPQHLGFCFRVQKPDMWLCQAGWILPGLPAPSPFLNGGQIQARGLLDFRSSAAGKVAITGGTDDYRRASGEILITAAGGSPAVTVYTLTIETP